jgi:galactofuranosylgalactofuranosylrhamnosyl-N-acetylglucosaminyl-diphospho-decaprenol beta-1,5/1,6-galactofuranosyltransferase
MPSSTPAKSGSATTKSPTELPGRAPDKQLTGHSPTGQLEAQRGLFRGPNPICPDDLYARIEHGAAARERHRLVVHPHAEVSLDTYFGRFPAAYWQRWTVVDKVDVELVVTGSGRLTLVASDAEGETRVVTVQAVDAAKGSLVRLTAPLDKFLDGGFLWLDIATDDSDLVIEKLRWTVAPPKQLRATAVVICTFNRADDCMRTLEALASDREALDVLDAIYVVDQGSDTVESRQGFPDVDKALDGRLRYLRQPNLGGAGGFSRGMYEVAEVNHADHANLLFMDDDVLCEPEIAIRLTAFANRTIDPTIVGGQMLRLLHPTKLIAGAEYADFDQLVPGRVVDNALDDVDLLEEALDEDDIPTGKPNRGDRRVDAEYNAWWSCLIPSELVAALGYPLPLFFQWDDVEYGYRARANGFPTVTLPGAGLWHADFDWKDADKWSEYFAVRNAMIVSALHGPFDPRRIARTLISRTLRNLLSMQYGLVATVLKAAEDFLEGPAILRDGGVAAAAEIRKLRAEYPDTIMHAPSDLPGLRANQIPMVQAAPTPTLVRLVLLKRLVYLALGKIRYQLGTVPAADSEWWHMSQFDTAVVTDASQEGVRIRKRDRAMMVAQAKQLARVIRRLLAEGPQVREAYQAAVPELTSRENWQRLHGQSQGD